jgi:hypothetical protein
LDISLRGFERFDAERAASLLCLACAGPAIFAADALVIHTLARWQREGRLAPWTRFRFRYSLQSLILAVLGIGAYASLIFVLWRERLIQLPW